MAYLITRATTKLSKLTKRIRAAAGGTSAGKTISILQLLIDDAQADKKPTLTSVVSESFPHLKRGAMRDFKNIMMDHKYWKDANWNATDYTYTFESGSRIEFFSADQPSKVRGPRRDRLFINECNNIPYEAFDQLEVRTKEYIYLDWNPTSEFWFYERLLGDYEDLDFITVTYLDNEALDESIVKSIEARKGNSQWWRVYGLGLLGEVEGRIFTGWKTDLDEIPHEARLVKRGLDFGYSNDPTAIVDIYEYNGGFILDEVLYRKGMTNSDIANHLKALNNQDVLMIADSSEPKSIEELHRYGIYVMGANKGQGSINQGIAFMQSQRISVTKRSTNLIKEYRGYMWTKDKSTEEIVNKAQDFANHLMDATRYALESYIPSVDDEETEYSSGEANTLFY